MQLLLELNELLLVYLRWVLKLGLSKSLQLLLIHLVIYQRLYHWKTWGTVDNLKDVLGGNLHWETKAFSIVCRLRCLDHGLQGRPREHLVRDAKFLASFNERTTHSSRQQALCCDGVDVDSTALGSQEL